MPDEASRSIGAPGSVLCMSGSGCGAERKESVHKMAGACAQDSAAASHIGRMERQVIIVLI
ncbi:hypothetical protein CE91St61_03020 [Lachnospiraceae bacterium]|nr:hypothetical protein CE91St61_03020 [Lachnospiraceae bacterium]